MNQLERNVTCVPNKTSKTIRLSKDVINVSFLCVTIVWIITEKTMTKKLLIKMPKIDDFSIYMYIDINFKTYQIIYTNNL